MASAEKIKEAREASEYQPLCQFPEAYEGVEWLFKNETSLVEDCVLKCKKDEKCDIFNYRTNNESGVSTCSLYKYSTTKRKKEFDSSSIKCGSYMCPNYCGFMRGRAADLHIKKISTTEPLIAVKMMRDIYSGRVWRTV